MKKTLKTALLGLCIATVAFATAPSTVMTEGISIGKEIDGFHKKMVEKLQSLAIFKSRGITPLKTDMVGKLLQVQATASTGQKFYLFMDENQNFVIGQGFNKNGQMLQFKMSMEKFKKDAAYIMGSGEETYFLFTDPECPYCQKLETYLPLIKDKVKIYTFLFPLNFHKDAIPMSKYILSADSSRRAEVSHSIMVEKSLDYKNKKYTQEKEAKLNASIQKQQAIAKDLGVAGTPAMYDANGQVVQWPNLLKKFGIDPNKPAPQVKKKELPSSGKFGMALELLKNQNMFIELGKGKEDLFLFMSTSDKKARELFKDDKIKELQNKYRLKIALMLDDNSPESKYNAFMIMSQDKVKKAEMLIKIMNGYKLKKEEVKFVENEIKKEDNPIVLKLGSVMFVARQLQIQNGLSAFNKSGTQVDLKK